MFIIKAYQCLKIIIKANPFGDARNIFRAKSVFNYKQTKSLTTVPTLDYKSLHSIPILTQKAAAASALNKSLGFVPKHTHILYFLKMNLQ